MSLFSRQSAACAALAATLTTLSAAAAEPLSLAEAERLALEYDASTIQFESLADALAERAVADGRLPDPTLRLGAMGLPIDEGLDPGGDPMVQFQVGVTQRFPAGRKELAQRTRAQSEAQRARATDQRRQVLRAVRDSWLHLLHQRHVRHILQSSVEVFAELAEITQREFAAGRRSQQDVLRAELELGRLQNQLVDAVAEEEDARAMLARWTGEEASRRPLPSNTPTLAAPPDEDTARARLATHPALQAEDARIAAGKHGIDAARRQYRPSWALELTYGRRDTRRADGGRAADLASDLASAMVMVDLPLFRANRQDRRVAAAERETDAAQQARLDAQRALERQLRGGYARWQGLAERVRRYDDSLLPQARDNAAAAASAYRAGTGDFQALMRARLDELAVRLGALHIRVEHARLQAELLYLTGDAS